MRWGRNISQYSRRLNVQMPPLQPIGIIDPGSHTYSKISIGLECEVKQVKIKIYITAKFPKGPKENPHCTKPGMTSHEAWKVG